ncbi:MAG TPA: sialidase family protein, partial [Isosphaeraceae bacterium]|nr:sialidase family protein [Isosphaeraceae bacterium]
MGLDPRELAPLLMQRVAVVAAEARPFQRAAIVMRRVGDEGVSAKTIERVVHDVDPEMAERGDAVPRTDEGQGTVFGNRG